MIPEEERDYYSKFKDYTFFDDQGLLSVSNNKDYENHKYIIHYLRILYFIILKKPLDLKALKMRNRGKQAFYSCYKGNGLKVYFLTAFASLV